MKTSTTVRLPATRLLRVLAIVLSSVWLLSACGPSEAEKQAQADAEAATRAATKARLAKQAAAADPTSNMAHAVVIGKSQAVTDLKYDISSKPTVGEPIEIELAFIPAYDGDSINATITSVSSDLVLEGDLTPTTSNVKAGVPWNTKLVAHATLPNAYYFNVAVDHNAAGVRSARTFAIPFFVAAPKSDEPVAAAANTQQK